MIIVAGGSNFAGKSKINHFRKIDKGNKVILLENGKARRTTGKNVQ